METRIERGKRAARAILLLFAAAAAFFVLSSRCFAAELPEEFIGIKKLAAKEKLEPLGFDAKHVQGLAASEDFFWVTSVDKDRSRGWLFKINRKTGKIEARKNVARLFHIHPSGFQYDGEKLWVAAAVYQKNSGSIVRAHDPNTLDWTSSFEIDDHIGALASDGKGLLYGANWDSEKFYVMNHVGKILETHENPTGHAYQDCEYHDGFLLCSGGGWLDWIDVETWKAAQSLKLDNLQTATGANITREGMSYLDGVYYFLPEDGNLARVYMAEAKK